MKPERIQFAPLFPQPSWGFYQTFWFETYSKADNFSRFVADMAENHGREVSLAIDPVVFELTLLVRAEDDAEAEVARQFADKVVGQFVEWSAPVTAS
jgi:hypothetical protein